MRAFGSFLNGIIIFMLLFGVFSCSKKTQREVLIAAAIEAGVELFKNQKTVANKIYVLMKKQDGIGYEISSFSELEQLKSNWTELSYDVDRLDIKLANAIKYADKRYAYEWAMASTIRDFERRKHMKILIETNRLKYMSSAREVVRGIQALRRNIQTAKDVLTAVEIARSMQLNKEDMDKLKRITGESVKISNDIQGVMESGELLLKSELTKI